MFTFKYAVAENTRIYMSVEGEFRNPKITPNIVSIITINVIVTMWCRITKAELMASCVVIGEVLSGLAGCLSTI